MAKGRPVTNKFKVPAKQWKRWSPEARRMFNKMFYSMRTSMQFIYMHPKCPPMDRLHWQTLRWNAAWEAACLVDGHSHAAPAYEEAIKRSTG